MPRVLIRRTPLADFLAALTLLTRLPVWRLVQPPQEAYRHTVPYWPLTGWITGRWWWICWKRLPSNT